MNVKKTMLLFLVLLFTGWAAAVDLFSATVPIADESPEARRQAMAEALHQVLVKASGQQLSMQDKKLRKILDHAEDQVQEFRYVAAPVEREGEEPGKLLWARFGRKAVVRLLHELGLNLWEGGRPELILWLAVDGNGKRHLVDPERENTLLEAGRVMAEKRGIGLVLPLMDLKDRDALSVSDLRMGHTQSIREASSRYGQAVPLAGRLQPLHGKWQGDWLLLLPEGERQFRSDGGTPEAAVQAGVQKAVELLVDRYLPAVADDSESSPVRLRFVNVQDAGGYARIIHLLRSLDMVVSLRPLKAEQDQLLFEARVRGGRTALQNQLSLETDLVPTVDIPDDGEATVPLETLSYSLR